MPSSIVFLSPINTIAASSSSSKSSHLKHLFSQYHFPVPPLLLLCRALSSLSKMMKIQKSTILLAIICFLLIHEMYLGPQLMTSAQKIDCGGKCSYRCSKASRQKMCLRACNTCCQRCNCVPPGTSGNTNVCPCYAHMTTHGGRLKCP